MASEFSNSLWRLLQALHDIQEALSALTFFMDIPERMDEIERRRFRCYHDAMTVSYWRPFSESKGLPKLKFSTVGIRPSATEKGLHRRIGDYRNKLVAHTDTDRMRMRVKALQVDDFPKLPYIIKDEGFEFLNDQRALETWFRKLRSALQERVFDLVQTIASNESVTIDWLERENAGRGQHSPKT